MRFEPMPSPLPGMRLWGAKTGGYQFVISHEDGATLKPADREEWVGYTASFKDPSATKPVRLGRWQSLASAEDACRRAWRQIRSSS
jgi:hypothetical protein